LVLTAPFFGDIIIITMEMPISQILLLSAVLLVGFIILAIGYSRKNRTVEVVGASLLIAVVIAFFVESQEVRDILVSFAIVVVAIISAANINELRDTRQQSAEKENRDRKERLLNEVIDWSKTAIKRIFPEVKPISEAIKEAKDKRKIFELPDEAFEFTIRTEDAILESARLETEISEAEYLLKIATGIDDKLADLISTVVDKMKSRKDLLYKSEPFKPSSEKSTKDEQKWRNLLGGNARELRESLLNVTNKALEIKLNILNS